MSETIHVILRGNWYAGHPFGRFKTAGPRTTVPIPAKLKPFLPSTAQVFDKPMTARDFIQEDPAADELSAQADLYDGDLARANADETARIMQEAEDQRIANLEKKMGITDEEEAEPTETEPEVEIQDPADPARVDLDHQEGDEDED